MEIVEKENSLTQHLGIFVLLFAFIWIIQFVIGKHNVRRMNENLHNVKGSRNE